jgi:hypothetical protein
VLGSDAVPDPNRLVRLIEVPRRLPAPQPELDPDAIEIEVPREPAYPLLVAAALLRAGRPVDALRQLDRSDVRDRSANWLRMIAHRRAGPEREAAQLEALLSPGSLVPRLGLVAGPLALSADLTPYYHWDDWRDVLPPPPSAGLLFSRN